MVDTITQRASDFTNRDFDSWVVELRARSNAAFPNWTDFNTANFGNLTLEMFAHTLDVISFTQDQQYLETRVVFARLRRSMIALGKNVGFRLPGATVATVDLEITIADGIAVTGDIVLPKGTVVKTLDLSEDVEFDLVSDTVIPFGFIQVTTAAAENARERSDTFVADGQPNLPVQLSQVPFVDGSADGLVVIAGNAYDEQEDFLNSGPADKHFVVDVNDGDRATLRFGDGINGEAPSGSGIVTYKTGGGSSGNVDANTLVQFRDGDRFTSLQGENVQLTVRNPSGTSDAVDRMGVEEARVAIPASLRTTGERSVTQQDFEDNARKVRGVARSMMLTSDDDPSIPENTGKLYIVPVGGGLPSALLKTQVADFINGSFPTTLTFTFSVEDPVLLILSITATVFLNTGVSETDARTAIEAAYDGFFALTLDSGAINEQIDFGFRIRKNKMPAGTLIGEIPFSDLFSAIRDSALPDTSLALRKVDEDLFIPTEDQPVLDTEFPVVGSIVLINGVTGFPF